VWAVNQAPTGESYTGGKNTADATEIRRFPNQCSTIVIKYSEKVMLHYAIVFLIVALIAAVFGFGGIAAGAAGIAKVLFVVFLIGAVVSFLMHGRGRV
jgi:uncharacterized membrane protein YtjA (UPF0391 family)